MTEAKRVRNAMLYTRETGEWFGEEVQLDIPKTEQRARLDRAA